MVKRAIMATLGSKYSMFPLTTAIEKTSYDYYIQQQQLLWTANEIDLSEDRVQYGKISDRYKELYADLLAFFSPGDGLVCENVNRFIEESDNFGEKSFFIIQSYIELVHAESYGMAITSVIKNPQLVQQVVNEVDNNEAVKLKALYLKKYIESDSSKKKRFLAAACTEGIFFVTLFAIIFYFRNKNIMTGFVFLNEQVSKDETLHRDYYCQRVRMSEDVDTKEDIEEMYDIVREAVEVEIAHLEYILRKPIDSVAEDKIAGITIENLTEYAKSLGNEILRLSGYTVPLYKDVKNDVVPWLIDIGMNSKTNFYEGKVASYRNTPKETEDDNVDFDDMEDEDF